MSPLPDDRGGEPVSSAALDWDRFLTELSERGDAREWVTLEEAGRLASVSRSTLRSWYRNGRIPSRMVPGPHGPQRIVPLEAVLEVVLASSRARRQLEHARSLAAEVEELRARLEAIERHLGLSGGEPL